MNSIVKTPWFQSYFAALGLLLTVSAIGCVDSENADTQDEESVDSAQSAMSYFKDLNASLLLEYQARYKQMGNNQNINYPFCVYSNFDQPITGAQRETFRAQMDQVANRWNDALKGQAGWPVQKISFYLVGTSTSCPTTDSGRKVLRIMGDKTPAATTGAVYGDYFIKLRKSDFDGTVNKTLPEYLQLNLHEYGHHLGLGDCYSQVGYQQPVDQPPSIMKDIRAVTDLTDDDVSAIRHVWARLSNASAAICPAGYKVGTTNEGGNWVNFCVYPRYFLTAKSLGSSKHLEKTPAGIVMSAESFSSTQEWRLTPTEAGGGYIHIKNRSYDGLQNQPSDYCLSVNPLKMTGCSKNNDSQLWKVENIAADPGFMRLKNKSTGQCLAISGGSPAMANCLSIPAQYWQKTQNLVN